MTRPSAVADLLSGEESRRERSLAVIASAYWKPVYKYLRLRWSKTADDAEELTQGFFMTALDRDTLAAYDPTRGRFRTFLRTCLDRHVIDAHRSTTAARRGGGTVALDFVAAEAEVAGRAGDDVERVFDAEWVRHVMDLAVTRLEDHLRARGKPVHAILFREFHLTDDPPSYADASARHGVSVADVTNWLHVARREFRRIALALLRELTVNDAEFADEAREVFGIVIPTPQAG